MRILSSGFSHSGSYNAIIDGLPAGIKIDEDFINSALNARRQARGRSIRMKTESDKIEILSGCIDGKTTGAPLSFCIKTNNCERVSFCGVRPSHADYPGAVKYGFSDISLVSERASARETVNVVAAGSIACLALNELEIKVEGRPLSICGQTDKTKWDALINNAKKEGDTLGGEAEVVISGVPAGFGGYSQYDRKLDGILAAAIMSLPAVKAVEIGLGRSFADKYGSQCLDYIKDGKRETNYSGGIDGGMSNGSDIVLRFTIKPVPSLSRQFETIDIGTKKTVLSPKLRADVCIVESAAVIAQNAAAYVILNEILLTLGGDTMEEVKTRFYQKKRSDFLHNKL